MAALPPALLALLGGVVSVMASDLQVSVSPSKATVPRGASVLVNCSFSGCDREQNPGRKLGLETELTKVVVDTGPTWQLFNLTEVLEDSRPLCFLTCSPERQATATVSLTVYAFPEHVELEQPLQPWYPAGESVTLRCRVAGGTPRDRLAVVLLRGQEELSRQQVVQGGGQRASSQQQVIGEPEEPVESVEFTVPVGRGDHGANFSCRTELDLRPEGLELFVNTSAARQLQTFVLPATPPELVTTRTLEVGTRQQVTCSLSGLFPASEAKVHLALGDLQLNATVTYHDDSLTASAWLEATAQEEGDRQLVCAILLGNRSRASRSKLIVYSFPEPVLTLNATEVSEGDVVMVNCETHSGAIATLSEGTAVLPAPHLLLKARAEDNGRRFFCSGALKVAGKVLYKNQTQQLAVLYGPRLDESSCPRNWTLPEGSQQTLRCQALGNPPPQLRCHRRSDNASLPIGSPGPVRRELEGTYVCRAVSSRGEATREVLVTVLYDQGKMIIVIALVTIAGIVGFAALAAYLYNRQRKIREYKLQKAAQTLLLKPKLPLPEPGPNPVPPQQQQQQC
ncbi:intercellular adhesion molecule 1 [Cavia porcellus]|uniref:intercellular adhesion molecule 1 n=1 Tax=Cavia porcellus TaxID=10141 RepID=UPI002FE116A1